MGKSHNYGLFGCQEVAKKMPIGFLRQDLNPQKISAKVKFNELIEKSS